MFRTAGIADLDALYGFEMLCFQDHPFRRDHIAWILENDQALTIIEDGKAGVRAAVMLLFEGRTCRILSVGVLPGARRRGIATRMLLVAETIGRERGCSTLRLEVSTANLPAIELYRRLGYRTDGVLYGYYSWGEDAYSMEKEISSLTAEEKLPEPPEIQPYDIININQ